MEVDFFDAVEVHEEVVDVFDYSRINALGGTKSYFFIMYEKNNAKMTPN